MKRLLLSLTFVAGLATAGVAMAHHTGVPHEDTISRTPVCGDATCPAEGGK